MPCSEQREKIDVLASAQGSCHSRRVSKKSLLSIQSDVPLAPLTTIKLGGVARHFVNCQSTEEIQEALQVAEANGWPVHVLGGGSNTIFADEGFRGLVIRVDLHGIEKEDEETVTVQAGEVWDEFVQRCIADSLAGVECLSGIPGSVGATPMQNVGAYGQEVAETITHVQAIDRQTKMMQIFSNTDCRFQYRSSRFKQEDVNRFIITAVTFKLRKDGEPTWRYSEVQQAAAQDAALKEARSAGEKLAATRRIILTLRRRKSMVVDPADPHSVSCGSFFTNPLLTTQQLEELQQGLSARQAGSPGQSIPAYAAGEAWKVSAAWLIEQAGFRKGQRQGNVGISPNHTLALVNYGGSTRELLAFAHHIQEIVHQKLGVALTREPVAVE